MAKEIKLYLSMKPKWWMRPAILAAWIALRLGLIRAKPDPQYHSGMISPEDRAAKWLADFAFKLEVR